MTSKVAKARRRKNYKMNKKNRIYLLFNGLCFWCDQEVSREEIKGRPKASRDHILPKSKGGSWNITNFVLACCSCNRDRGDKYFEEYMIERELLQKCGLFTKKQATKIANLLFQELSNYETSSCCDHETQSVSVLSV